MAFMDTEIPLPDGQCMLAPRVEARLLQELQLQRHESVLEIGAGSGFMAALLGPPLAPGAQPGDPSGAGADGAGQPRRRGGKMNATVRCADGSLGAAGEAPLRRHRAVRASVGGGCRRRRWSS